MTNTLKAESVTVAGCSPHIRFRKGPGVAQVASLLLVIGAGLFAAEQAFGPALTAVRGNPPRARILPQGPI